MLSNSPEFWDTANRGKPLPRHWMKQVNPYPQGWWNSVPLPPPPPVDDIGYPRPLLLDETGISAVADPGFPRGGGANPKGGRQPIIWPIFAENCMKMKKFWAGEGRVPRAPLRSATALCPSRMSIKKTKRFIRFTFENVNYETGCQMNFMLLADQREEAPGTPPGLISLMFMQFFLKNLAKQEGLSAWTQEAYRPPRSKCLLCWSVLIRGGTSSSPGGGYPIQSWMRKAPHPVLGMGGIPSSPG